VNAFDLAQSFIERCRSGEPADHLVSAFQRTVENFGFRYFACCSHVDPLNPPPRAVVLHSYPQEWARAFSELDFFEIDPILHHASRTLTPFFWDSAALGDELTPPQQELFAEAKRHGISRGYTVPIHLPRPLGQFRASCSVVPDGDNIDPAGYFAIQLMSCYVYEAVSADAAEQDVSIVQRGLSRRERQCLELAAQGKTDWAAGKILGISERTVHNHIENAKRRLSVATRVQAIVHALASREISFGDVIRNDVGEDRHSRRKTGSF
jgi:DNA-binding CsgD family transcriptional regulator